MAHAHVTARYPPAPPLARSHRHGARPPPPVPLPPAPPVTVVTVGAPAALPVPPPPPPPPRSPRAAGGGGALVVELHYGLLFVPALVLASAATIASWHHSEGCAKRGAAAPRFD